MTKLVHGGDIYTAMEEAKGREILDYSANINPMGLPKSVKTAVLNALEMCDNYPDPLCRKLRRAVAQKEALPEEYLIFGNGAADLIFRLAAALKPGRAMVLAPTFAEYEKALSINGCKVSHYFLKEQEGFALGEEFLLQLDASFDMLFLCNPNNPTGQLIPQRLLKRIADACREMDIFLVVDECFIDFLERPEEVTVKGMLRDHKNMFILRAFTKNYAMPGLRLGYGICSDQETLDLLFEAGQPWSVSLIAQEAGISALKEEAYLAEARQLIFEQREKLQRQLSAFGYTVYPPAANYIFFKLRETDDPSYVDKFIEDMAEEGILIRSCANYKGIEKGYFRIAVRTEEENRRLVETLDRREQRWQKQ